MKREKKVNSKEKKGIRFNPSDVYEVEFVKDCGNGAIKKGEKKLVTIPVALKLEKQGKIKADTQIKSVAEKMGFTGEAIKWVENFTAEKPKDTKEKKDQ